MVNNLFIRLSHFYSDHIDPDGIQPRQAFRTMVAGILAILVYHALPWQQAYWVLVSSVLLLQTYAGDTPRTKIIHLGIATLGATILTYLASRLLTQTLALAIFLSLTTFISYYCYAMHKSAGNIAVYLNLFCLSAGALTVSAADSWQRAVSVSLGGGVAMLVCLCCFPERSIQQLQRSVRETLLRLADFNHTLLLRRKQTKVVNSRRNRFIRGQQLALQQITSEEIQTQAIIDKIATLYEILLILHQLRRYLRHQPPLSFLAKAIFLFLQHTNQLLVRAAYHPQTALDLAALLHLPTFENAYAKRCTQLTTLQTLAFIVYIDSVHKLKKLCLELVYLLQHKTYY